MKKKALSLILALVLVLGLLPVTAQADRLSSGLEYKIIGDHVEITGYTGNSPLVVIPDRIAGFPVTSIGTEAFFCCDLLTDIELPDSLTSIGSRAFYNCSSLTEIELPESITTIGDGAFFSCIKLTEFIIPEGVVSIGEQAFYKCVGLTGIDIPASVVTVGSEAFSLCSGLLDIRVDENNRNYSSDDRGILFNKEKTLLIAAPGGITDSYEVPVGVTAIGKYAFFFCNSLLGITIPDSVVIIDDSAIYGCGSLTEIRVDENNRIYSSDDRGVLFNKEKTLLILAPGWLIDSYQIPDGVIFIGDYAFNCCDSLLSIIISETVTSIGNRAFSDCQGLRDIVIPQSVTSIGDNAFSSCYNLSTIRFAGNAPEFGEFVFSGITATASYPVGDPSWTSDVMQNYGGTISWIAYEPHVHEYTSAVTAPTCTEQGFTTHACACGDSYVSDHTDPLGHDMGEWEPVSDPTCTKDGTESRSCSRCGNTETRAIEATGHSHEAAVTAPTCTVHGWTTYTCHCGDFYLDDFVDALGHDYADGTCTRCGRADPEHQPTGPSFTDVPTDSFFEEPVEWAVENGVTFGTSDTTFSPGDLCLRAHVVTFLWRAAGCPAPQSSANPFVDVTPGAFYYDAVLWAVENGITNGTDATHFDPAGICNRVQIVAFLHRAFGSPAVEGVSNPFSDVPVDAWYAAPILWAVENGVTNGLSATEFGPTADCNRAQAVTFLYRAYN